MEIFRRVEELMWEDPMSLLPSDRHLLEEDIDILGTCSTAVRKYWIIIRRLKCLPLELCPGSPQGIGIKPLYHDSRVDGKWGYRSGVMGV